jgi:ABC-type Zn uptake system ZnuABC Zn-binding protein ZnuA
MFKKSSRILPAIIVFLILGAMMMLAGCAAQNTTRLKVVTSTSLIAQIVDRIGGDKVSVVNIIPPAQCPGHFDVKAGDIQKLADARLFFIHNWQGEKFSDSLIASANNSNLSTIKLEIAGNWMTPPVQKEGADKIAAVLTQLDPANGSVYQSSAEQYKSLITAKESELKAKLAEANLSKINVLCDEQQAGFVNGLGSPSLLHTGGRKHLHRR